MRQRASLNCALDHQYSRWELVFMVTDGHFQDFHGHELIMRLATDELLGTKVPTTGDVGPYQRVESMVKTQGTRHVKGDFPCNARCSTSSPAPRDCSSW